MEKYENSASETVVSRYSNNILSEFFLSPSVRLAFLCIDFTLRRTYRLMLAGGHHYLQAYILSP